MLPILPNNWNDSIANLGPDDRILTTAQLWANIGMVRGYNDAYGYDPIVLKRYAEFLSAIQSDVDPDANQSIDKGLNGLPAIFLTAELSGAEHDQAQIVASSRLWFMRVRYIFWDFVDPSGRRGNADLPLPPRMRRTQLFQDWKLKTTRQEVLAAIEDPNFNPQETILLEQEPDPTPATSSSPGRPPGTVSVVDIDSDSMEITADLPIAQILLITDTYARDWHAHALDENAPQSAYQVLPADYTFRAIPLAAGHHHFLLEYLPESYIWGKRITSATFMLWLCAAAGIAWRRWRPRGLQSSSPSIPPVTT